MTSHIASRISRTRWKTYFSAEQLYQHLYDAWGSHEKGSLFSQVVENARRNREPII